MNKKEIIFKSEYLETIKELVKMKVMIQDEEKNQREILQSENLQYTPDFYKNIEKIITQFYQVLYKSESIDGLNLEYKIFYDSSIVDIDGLKDYIQYNTSESLKQLEGLKFDYDRYYLIDNTDNTIKEITINNCFDLYDNLCNELINEFMSNIANLESIFESPLFFEGKKIEVINNNDNYWYNLTFENETILQSETLYCYKFFSPLFSALIVKLIKELKSEVL